MDLRSHPQCVRRAFATARALLVVLLAAPLAAHGQGYRLPPSPPAPPAPSSDPGDVLPAPRPPGPTPAPPRGTGRQPPSVPGGTPSTARGGMPIGPGTRSGSPASAGGMSAADGVDLTRWQYWWEYNKDPFLRLKEAVHAGAGAAERARGTTTRSDAFFMGAGGADGARDTLAPTDAQISESVLPALRRALEADAQRDIVSAAMVAIAKIGVDHPDFRILPLLSARLQSRDQEVRETAALAMGITGMPAAVDPLVALVSDSPAGRRLVDRAEVDDRTRTFAAYGLGLIANTAPAITVQHVICRELGRVLTDEPDMRRNLKVAAVNALAQVRADARDPQGRVLIDYCLGKLEDYYRKDLGPADQLIQAHVPPAIAKLCARYGDHPRTARFVQLFLAELRGDRPGARSNRALGQSAALALGRMTAPWDDDHSPGADVAGALLAYYRHGKDHQATYFCLIALAQIGGAKSREALLDALEHGTQALEKPWAALALGVLGAERARGAGHAADFDPAAGEALRGWLRRIKNPETLAAIAVGLGLLRHRAAADDLLELLDRHRNKDELAGYLCIALALMDEPRAIEPVRAVVVGSVRRPKLIRQAAISLGVLGDKRAAETLQHMLGEGEPNMAQLGAIATAIGFIGDRRSIDALTELAFDESKVSLARAFAFAALGGIADRRRLPWNSELSRDINYRASVSTLTNTVNGVLDIL